MYDYIKTEIEENKSYIVKAKKRYAKEEEIIFQSPLKEDYDAFVQKEAIITELTENNTVEDLRKVENKELIGYWRMYYRHGWNGVWFQNSETEELDSHDIKVLDNTIIYVCNRWSKGCDYFMTDDMKEHFSTWGEVETLYLLQPKGFDNCLICINTEFGNGDYPVRIYMYRDKNN